MVMVEVEDD